MPQDLDLTTFKVLSFDCYGTLIDWETGIAGVLGPWARDSGLELSDEELLLAYSDNEAAVEQQAPATPYPDVLATAFRRTGERLGKPVGRSLGSPSGRIGTRLAGLPGLRRRAGAAAPPLRADHPLQRAPRRICRQQPAPARRLHRDHHRRGRRRLQARREPLPRAGGQAVRARRRTGPSCSMSRRASSMTTCRPSARV